MYQYKLNGLERGINEKGIDVKTNKILVEIDSKYFRPSEEVKTLLGDPSKAVSKLGWDPKKKRVLMSSLE